METCHWIQEEGVEKEAKWLMFSCGRIRSYQEHCSSSSQEKQIPSKVKDGVSESQFNQVLNIELDQIIETNQAVRMSATFYITGWLAIYFSEGAWSLDIGRFLTGYRIGVFSYVVPIFIAEIAPKISMEGLQH
ncbi:sugar transporter ERD6-like 8 [Rosa rugosa]|uniref:sugar transporter ERD6-like 8 n=1 Tax=Rosa rugosa TaxID=74645 RepID=UPI002B413AFE|nr:sugar transporter ERD6-like 8 [Rosa rugosa]